MAFRHLVSVGVVAAAFLFGCGQGDERYIEMAKVKKNADATMTLYAGEEKIEIRSLSSQAVDITKAMATEGWLGCSSCTVSVSGGSADCGECNHGCDSHTDNPTLDQQQ